MRARGYTAYVMPEEVGGPSVCGRYAMVVRDNSDGLQVRMVHTEGVAYLVTDDKPWCWTDYDPDQKQWSLKELLPYATPDREVDLADWIRTFGSRLESNFCQIAAWMDQP